MYFLASDEAAYITGLLSVDGGRLAVECPARSAKRREDIGTVPVKHTGRGQAGKMKVIKRGGHRLFEQNTEAACPYRASGHTVRLGRAVQKCQASKSGANTSRFTDGPHFF